jgi:hypothetical protein
LDGRQDVEWLAQFNQRIAVFSDDGKTFHAPYGYRLRKSFGIDQVEEAINMLTNDPDTRRTVMAIWDPVNDLNVVSKDIPCNDIIMLKVRDGRLNMTVCCRSNDVLWGAYGANVVQFSTLQEFMANCIGVNVGTYHQISDSFHVYTEGDGGKVWDRVKDISIAEDKNEYKYAVVPFDMWKGLEKGNIEHVHQFHEALHVFFENPKAITTNIPFFKEVARYMYLSWEAYKENDFEDAITYADYIKAEDWSHACKLWLNRIKEKRGMANA